MIEKVQMEVQFSMRAQLAAIKRHNYHFDIFNLSQTLNASSLRKRYLTGAGLRNSKLLNNVIFSTRMKQKCLAMVNLTPDKRSTELRKQPVAGLGLYTTSSICT